MTQAAGLARIVLSHLLPAFALAFMVECAAPASPRTDLDRNWQFRADPAGSGEASGWQAAMPAGTQSVTLPHTWNIGPLHDYLGVAWYFRRFDMPRHFPGDHIELNFGATFYRARVWLNGIELGAHEGGFTAYSFDITRQLRDSNVLAVRIDNRPAVDTIPGFGNRGSPEARYDWWTYGGLVRDVWLTTTGPAWVTRQAIRTQGNAAESMIYDHIFLQSALTRSSLARHSPVSARVTAFDPEGRVAAAETRIIPLHAGAGAGTADITVSLKLARPQLWNIDHPDVYRMVVELTDRNHRVLDENSATFGVRTLEIRDRHLLLNGERVRLTGMARHEDSPWEGLAETAGTMRHDYDDMKVLHTTLSRPVHYPQNPFILDYADRHGILLIPEIPVWQFSEAQLSDPRVIALAKQQMREMIEQAGNHPSIFGWSVANESATGTPGGIAYFRALRDMIHEIDPGRPVSFADDNLAKLERADQSAANDADFVMMNQYFGSWHGPAEALVPALDKIDRLFPAKMVIISEMGFAGIFASGPVEADQARIKIMRDQMPLLAARDWIGGAILWCYQDYKSPRNLWPGETEGYVEHGLVDENRQRKPSYHTWKELNAPAKLTAGWTVGTDNRPAGFSVQVTANTERNLPFYPLHDYRLTWRLVDEKGAAVADGEQQLNGLTAAATINDALPAGAHGSSYRLSVTLLHPTGLVAADATLEWPPAHPGAK